MTAGTIGTYQLEGLLGEGGIGQVYAARDSVLGRPVAIKKLRPELSRDRNFVERFYNEAKSLGNLNHTNITTLYALNAEGDEAFMVMELVHGQTLEALLARVGRLTVRDSLAVLAQAVPGIRYAHRRGVIHRDLKPANLMLTEDGVVKIMDFGIARVRGSEHLTRVGEFCGTFVYASPEQIRGEEVDERSDIYSLAIVVYRMLAGNPPFEATNEYALMTAQLQAPPPPLQGQVPDLDDRTEQALMRALAKRPEDRFASVEEFGRTIGAHALRGDSADMLQQLYSRAFAEGDLEATVVAARPPALTAPVPAPSPPRSGGEFALTESLAALQPTGAQRHPERLDPRPAEAATPMARSAGPAPHPRPWRQPRLIGASLAAAALLLGSGYVVLTQQQTLLPLFGAASHTDLPAAVAAGLEPSHAPPSGAPAPSESAGKEPQPAGPAPLDSAHREPQPPTAPASVESAESAPQPASAEATQPRETTANSAPSPASPGVTAEAEPAIQPPAAPDRSEAARPTPPAPAEVVAAATASSSTTSGPEMAHSQVPAVATPPIPPTAPGTETDAATAPRTAAPSTPPAAEPRDRPSPDAVTAAESMNNKASPGASPAAAEAAAAQDAQAPQRSAPIAMAKNEPPSPATPPAPLGPQASPGKPLPEGEPDLQGRVTGAKRLDEIEVSAHWIRLYGIVDRARGAQEASHVQALVRYLKPSNNHVVCYRKPSNTYRCYSDGKDIARLALLDRMVHLAPNAPAEYRSLLAERR